MTAGAVQLQSNLWGDSAGKLHNIGSVMTTATLDPQKQADAETRFEWPLCYEAENFLLSRIDAFHAAEQLCPHLAGRMRDETGTLLLDWTDYLLLPASDEAELRATGYTDDPLADAPQGQKQLWHPEAMLPRVLIAATNAKYPLALGIRAEEIADLCRRARRHECDRRRTALAFPQDA